MNTTDFQNIAEGLVAAGAVNTVAELLAAAAEAELALYRGDARADEARVAARLRLNAILGTVQP